MTIQKPLVAVLNSDTPGIQIPRNDHGLVNIKLAYTTYSQAIMFAANRLILSFPAPKFVTRVSFNRQASQATLLWNSINTIY